MNGSMSREFWSSELISDLLCRWAVSMIVVSLLYNIGLLMVRYSSHSLLLRTWQGSGLLCTKLSGFWPGPYQRTTLREALQFALVGAK
jgi:hypothetical protein